MKSKQSKFNLLIVTFIASLCAITGCAARMTPQGAARTTTLAVYAFGENNPNITEEMRRFQPPACDLAKNQGATLEDIIGVVQNTGGASKDFMEVLLVISTIYQTYAAPRGTNTVDNHPYLTAVVCDGWGAALDLLPDTIEATSGPQRNAPPVIATTPKAKTTKKLPPGKWFLVRP